MMRLINRRRGARVKSPRLMIVRSHLVARCEADERDERSSYRFENWCQTSRGDGVHVVDIVRHDLSVVLDFPADTVNWPSWMRSMISDADDAHDDARLRTILRRK